MSAPFQDHPGSPPVPDVEAIMQRVRAGVADKLDRGGYTPADLEEIRLVEENLCERTDSGPAPAEDFSRLRSLSDPLGPHTFVSHRVVSGRLVVAAKQLLRRLALPVAAVTLARQAEFNGAVARLLDGAADGARALKAGNDELLRRLAAVERRSRELHARCDELQAEVRGLQARLDRDRPAARPE